MATTALCTIIAKNYLPAARVLMQSVKAHHPDFARFVLLVDEADGYFTPAVEDFATDDSIALEIANNRLFHYKYNVLELSTAVKPYYLQYLFDTYGFDIVLYADPDIVLYDQLTPVLDGLAEQNIVLTPHLTHPLDDDRLPGEHEILQSGANNLGFIGLRRSSETQRLLQWWQKKLYNDCISDVARNLFVDQRWIDLVPGMFDGVGILRDPGLNVAYWNLLHRRLEERDGRYVVNGKPLHFFHFSGFRADHHHTLSRHQNRYEANLPEVVDVLVEDYRTRLLAAGYMTCKDWPYAYSTFHDGSPIPDICRRIVRDDLALQAQLGGLDWPELSDALMRHFNEPYDTVSGSAILITRLAYAIYEGRRDVQRAYPDIEGNDRVRFATWFITDGALSYALPAIFVEPVAASLEAIAWHPNAPHERAAPPLRHATLSVRMDMLAQSHASLRTTIDSLRTHYSEFEAWSRSTFTPKR